MSKDNEPHQDDPLLRLSRVDAPKPSEDAKKRAQKMAMAAFDEELAKKSSPSTQGIGVAERPMSITHWIKGLFAMENRVAVTAAMSGLLLVPLGYVLMTNTALTPIPDTVTTPPQLELEESSDDRQSNAAADGVDEALAGDLESDVVSDIVSGSGENSPKVSVQAPPPLPSGQVGGLLTMSPGEAPMAEAGEFAVARTQQAPMVIADEPMPVLVEPMPQVSFEGGAGDQFTEFEDAGVTSVATGPVSTFSIDVDTASYSYMRRALNEGWLPPADSVRVEEFINAFDYDYAQPTDADIPFTTDISVAPSPWDEGKLVMRVGVQGFDIAAEDRPPANLVFLIDSSGSMSDPDKLPLLITSFSMMLDGLDADDTVSIVTYAGSAGVVLEPTAATEKREILKALQSLAAGGSTSGAAGIEVAYDLAADAFVEDGVNQVILATDGDFNVGISSPDKLADLIADKRDEGVFLSVLGFGSGNLNDQIMQSLAQNGNGTAYYIDGLREAQDVLVNDLTSTLVPIAKDVKIQVEFNPAQIAEYRLIGYETRALNREDFNNDRVDAGEVGAGSSVTAIYELTPVGSESVLVDPLRYGSDESVVADPDSDELGYFKLRYKLPNEDRSRLMEVPITSDLVLNSLDAADEEFRFALSVSALGQKLRGNSFVDGVDLSDIRELAAGARGEDEDGSRAEFLSLIDLAAALSR